MLKYADVQSEEVLKMLKTSREGLSAEGAAERLQRLGANALKGKKKKSVAGIFFSQLLDVMTVLLIAAACISAVVAYLSGDAGDLVDTAIIAGIILLNAVVGTVQQYRADRAIESLKKLNSLSARVRRGGEILSIDAEELTVGDVVLLEEGDVVPADMRLISSTDLRCEEASLTGESAAVEKSAGKLVVGAPVNYSNAVNLVFSSTFVVGGSGEGVVTAVGGQTEIGAIAQMLDDVKKSRTPLEKSLDRLGKILSLFVIGVAAVIFAFGMIKGGGGLIKNFMTAVAIAVAAIPEGLPAVVSVIMAMGVQRMSRRNVIIRKMKCVETLGGCNCICTDKTGTLTCNRMQVVTALSAEGAGLADRVEAHSLLAACMSVCTRVKEAEGKLSGDPTEVAIKRHAQTLGFNQSYSVTGEIPFSSDRKLMSVRAELGGATLVFVKGAPEEVLKRCTTAFGRAITQEDRRGIEEECRTLSSQALRVLAFAYKEGDNLTEEGLTFLGLCGMTDPLKEGVREAVASCNAAGVATVMITGDSPQTAFAIARQAGIAESYDRVYTGAQLDEMTKPQLSEAIARGRVFARVSPKHKNIIVKIKQAQGDVVAMTGDGVNDAPSVKSADIGIVMGKSGTEVTKSVADMVICDDNFTTIVAAVREGRRISANVKKTIDFFLSTNLAEVLSIVVATFAFFACGFLPSTQLLWINLITDSFPVLALGVERGGEDCMNKPPVRAEKSLFSRGSLIFVLFSALYITAGIIGAYAFTLAYYGSGAAITVAFLTMSFAELFHAFNVRSGERSALSGILSNKVLLATVALGVAVNVLLCISPLAPAFSLAAIPPALWGVAFGVALSVIPVCEVYKLISRKIRGR